MTYQHFHYNFITMKNRLKISYRTYLYGRCFKELLIDRGFVEKLVEQLNTIYKNLIRYLMFLVLFIGLRYFSESSCYDKKILFNSTVNFIIIFGLKIIALQDIVET